MKTSTQVVVIGGGVVGASILYHLTKAGWTDVVLVERKELTAGSTWHAAGGMLTLNGDPNIAALQRYTVQLYKDIEEISGVNCGIHQTGELMLADTEERLDWLRMINARGQYLSMETEMISVSEAKEMLPILEEKHFAGAMWDPVGGHVDPSGVTNAYAAAARMAGAEVYRNTWAHDLVQKNDGTWDVVTEQGTIHTEHIVNCGGLWAREVGRMCGIELPILAMEHMYLLTEEIPEIKPWLEATGGFGFGAVDFGGEIYLRAEGGGLLLGTYEKACVPWSVKETPWDFGSQLLTPDLDRLTPSFEVSFAHFPIFNEVGIKQVINGPFTFAPDGNPLIGPVRGQKGHWVACGVMAGLSQGGGVGLAMANWMTTGDPGFDIWGMDVARYGDWTTPGYTQQKVMENYGRRFQISFPNEELPAGRPLYTSPIHERLTEENAVWGASYGLENALWFQEKGKEPIEDVTFKRSNAFELVGEEVRAVREKVGLMETTGFAKHEFSGSGAREFLDNLVTNRVPSAGRLTLAPMLNEKGMLIGDFTIATLADPFNGKERFLVFGSGIAEGYHHRWFTSHLPNDGSVSYRVLSHEMTGLSIAGPFARDVLASLVEEDVSNKAFRFLDIRPMNVGMVPAIVGRISFSGDLGYEFWVPASLQASLFDLLVQAGEPYGMKLFGLHALNSLRFDKNFGGWATEYRPIYNPWEAGLGPFIKLDKGDFIGREAALAAQENGVGRKLTAFTIDTEDADAVGDEPIWVNGEVVGWVTSGGYAHWSQASCALGYVPVDAVGIFEIEILGKKRLATPLDEPLFDPSGSKMRS